MAITKPTIYPDGTAIDNTTDIALTTGNWSATRPPTGYATGAEIPHQEYNEMLAEIAKWIKWMDQNTNGYYNDLGLNPSNIVLVGATGSVSIQSGKYCINGFRVHLDIVITIASLSGTLTSLSIALPSSVNCLARYVGFAGSQFLINNTNGGGPQSIQCTAGFYLDNSHLVISQSVTALNTYVPFLTDGSGNIKFSISIEYEVNH